MNKQILLTLLVVLSIVVSVSAISASDVNVTDSYTTDLVDDTSDVSVPLEDTAGSSEISVSSDSNVDNDSSKVSLSSEEGLESENSNTLSTNSNSDLVDTENGTANVLSSSDAVLKSVGSSKSSSSKSIQVKNHYKFYKGSTQYVATFYDNQGNALAKTKVKITMNGVTYTKTTNANGVASLKVNLNPGKYKVIAENPLTGYTLTTNFRVYSTISAKNLNKIAYDGRKYTAKFLNGNGKALAQKYIKFKINGKTYSKKTNKNGVASLSLKNLGKGTYKIDVINKDGLSVTKKVKVYNVVSVKFSTKYYTFLKSTKSKTIKATLTNGLGYSVGSGKIVKITINGKTYTKKTNSKGVVSLKLPSLNCKIYAVKYKFAGTSHLKKSTVSNRVAVIPSKDINIKVLSTTTVVKGVAHKFKVKVLSGSVPLANKVVKFTLNGKTYQRTTNAYGIATISYKLDVGDYPITYSVNKDSKTNAKSGSSKIVVKAKISGNHAYWLFGADMKSVNLPNLASNGVTDILLNFKAYELYGKSGVETWVASANKVGISVHMWTQIFYYNGKWINPISNGKENTKYFNNKINALKRYAAIKGIAGIHMDYLRYPGTAYKTSGGAAAITSFTKQAVSAVKAIKSGLVVSAALMPETTSNKYYYGQDFAALSQYLDVAIPMIYKGNYGQGTSWITSTTKWFVSNSKGAKVWAGLQSYKSDSDTSKLSVSALTTDIQSALNGDASGVVLFRYGLSNNINFNKISRTTSSTTISISDIIDGASTIKAYYASNSKLPGSVKAGGHTFTMPQFLYLMGKAIYQIGNSNTKAVTILKSVAGASSPSGDSINSQHLTKANYLKVANNVAKFINTYKQAPNYASSAVGKIIYSELVDSFSRVLAYYGSNKALPNYVVIKTSSGGGSGSSGNGLNEPNTYSSLTSFLKATTNCQVGNAKIKSVVNSVTKGATTARAKAVAIYNYVRDHISYSFYYNTQHGAVGTLNAGSGNCVDQSHLLVAMFRTAGLAARYVHGTCTFSSGSTYGHVWTQVVINNNWVVADPTSERNSFGTVVNWNTHSYSVHGKYASLSF